MRIPGSRTLRRAASRFRRGVVIVLYHRVAALPSDPHQLAVTPRHFEEHLAVVRRRYRPLSLQALVHALQTGAALPRCSVVITFDDGFADNLHQGKPLLERADCPATVFVASGYVGQRREFWWDELERLLLEPGDLPPVVQLGANGHVRQWQVGDAAYFGEDEYQAQRSWNGERVPGPRQRFFLDVFFWLRILPEPMQRFALDQLVALTGKTAPRPTHLPMTLEELRRLDEGGLVEIGAHTVTHAALAAHPPAVQREEIGRSKHQLEEALGHAVRSFAYPFGTRSDYTPETVSAVRSEAFTCSCSNYPGVVRRRCDPYELPRFVVRDWDGDTFARRLEEWFCA